MAVCISYLRRYVEVRGEDECWPWIGYRDPDGYGRFRAIVDEDKKTHLAHRVAFEEAYGYLPLVVRHRCDNPPCCNPLHLLPGTHTDNIRDRVARGRSSRGERHGSAILTAEQVISIRLDTRKQVVIAAAYGVDQTTICNIIKRKIWKHVE